jgi:hypothetical protein
VKVTCVDGPCDGRIEEIPEDVPTGYEFGVTCGWVAASSTPREELPAQTEDDLVVAWYRLEEGHLARFIRLAEEGSAQ